MNNPGELVAVPKADLTELIARATKRWMSVASSAEYADLSDESIRRLLSSGKLTPHRPVRGKILIDRRELDSLISGSTGRPRTGRGRQVNTPRQRME